MAVNAFPTPGRSAARKRNCWRAGCAFRRSFPGPPAFRPDAAYPADGMNLMPHLSEGAGAVERKLFWRYKALWQRAARIGDWKYLKILDNTFLFNVVEDPLERANQ